MGGAIHVRAATIPSPVLGLEKGDRESFGLAGLYMGQVRHMFFRAQVQEPESTTHNDVWYGVFERSVRAVWLLWSFPRRLILLISSRSLELRLSLYLSLSLSLSLGADFDEFRLTGGAAWMCQQVDQGWVVCTAQGQNRKG